MAKQDDQVLGVSGSMEWAAYINWRADTGIDGQKNTPKACAMGARIDDRDVGDVQVSVINKLISQRDELVDAGFETGLLVEPGAVVVEKS